MPPVRGRELKLVGDYMSKDVKMDAPCAGARIETSCSSKKGE